MTDSLCSRCQTVLHREDEGTLVFCWNCGAPQVQLSEELREQLEKQIAGQTSGPVADDTLSPPAAPGAVVWPGAIQCAGLAGAVAAVFGLFSLVLPPVRLLSVFWVVGAPAFILVIYGGRFRMTQITPGFGARLGLLSGLAIMLASFTLNTVELLLRRFAFHNAGPFDTLLAGRFADVRATTLAQWGPAATSVFDIPEFRAGVVLSSFAMLLVFYLIFAAAAGAISGYIRSRAPRPVR